MSTMVKSDLKAGIIYGDTINSEYIYMPAGEIGVSEPLCRLEKSDGHHDISLAEAVRLVRRLSLRPVIHPLWGKTSC